MSDQTIRAAILARLTAMGASIGRVHDYERWAKTPAEFLALFQDPTSKKVFGWEITRTGFDIGKVTMRKFWVSHKYTIRGYYGLRDADGTEKAVNALADAIALDFATTPLTGTQGEQLPKVAIETRMFGNVLCHVVEIRLPKVDEIVGGTDESELPALDVIGLNYYLMPGDDQADAVDTVILGD